MVPDRTPSRVAMVALVMVALAGASGCAHRRAPDLHVSNPPDRSLGPGLERGRAVEHRNGNGKSRAREERQEPSAPGVPAPETAPPAHARGGATSFGTSVVISPQPAPAGRESSTRAAE